MQTTDYLFCPRGYWTWQTSSSLSMIIITAVEELWRRRDRETGTRLWWRLPTIISSCGHHRLLRHTYPRHQHHHRKLGLYFFLIKNAIFKIAMKCFKTSITGSVFDFLMIWMAKRSDFEFCKLAFAKKRYFYRVKAILAHQSTVWYMWIGVWSFINNTRHMTSLVGEFFMGRTVNILGTEKSLVKLKRDSQTHNLFR